MKQMTVISGKGGTGKTSLTASFAALAHNAIVADCDVDAPDLALVLAPRVEKQSPFVGGKVARVDAGRCTGCGLCVESCRFEATALHGPPGDAAEHTCAVDPHSCEGCGVCVQLCPVEACRLEPTVTGEWFISQTRFSPLVHAQLGVGQDNSGKLVSCVRQEARALAEREERDLVLCDGPPGIGCPVIASLSGVDLLLIVVEPTVSALHDFERVADLARHFQIPALVCINKHDLNETVAAEIEKRADRLGVERAGRIPYDEAVVGAQLHRRTVVEHTNGPLSAAIRNIWQRIEQRLDLASEHRAP